MPEPEVYKHITLENCHFLNRFKFSCILSETNFNFLVHILRTSYANSITEMFIKFWGGWTPRLEQKLEALEKVDWGSLDTVLSGPKFRSMLSLCIEIDYLSGLQALPQFLEKNLPKAHKRNIFAEEVAW